MIVALALSAATFFFDPHPHRKQIAKRVYHVRAWTLVVDHDKFTDQVTCSLYGRRMRYLSGALVFHLRDGVETTHAVFRADDGEPTAVAQAFHQLEGEGYFPRRGWIDRVAGGDVALPPAYVSGARKVWIRASPRQPPSVFDLGDFDEALDRAQDLGCPENGFVDAKA